MQERGLCLEAPSHVDDDDSSQFRAVGSSALKSSPNLLSANSSGYASTVCRFCSCSTFTFPFPWWPDLCVGGWGHTGHRGRLGALQAGTASLKAGSACRSLWLAARHAVSVHSSSLRGSLAAAQARGGAQAAASGAGPAMSSRCGPTATGEAGQDQQGNRSLLL